MSFSRAMTAGWVLRSIFTLVTVMVCAISHIVLSRFGWWSIALLLFWVTLWAVLCFAYTPAFCRRFCGEFDGNAVRTHSGVLIRRQTVVPLSSLRTFEVWAPPIHRFFGCRTVILRFAGGCAWLLLISEKTARRLTRVLEKETAP